MTLEDNIEKLLLERPIPLERVIDEMAKASRLGQNEDIAVILKVAHLHDVFDEMIAIPAMALLPAWGEQGVMYLHKMALEGPYEGFALLVLADISRGFVPKYKDFSFLPECWNKFEKYELHPQISLYAMRCLREVILEYLTDTYMKSRLFFGMLPLQAITIPENSAHSERFDFLIDMIIDSHMVLNKTILEQFKKLIDQASKHEEELQQFFVQHPVLLDPFVAELRSKHELGDDFITDFIVRRINDEYVVVEIEKSTDRLFNQNGSFTSNLTIAVGQVRDFQAWISDNIAYAQTKLPGIRHPQGLVVIGRNTDITPEMNKRLSEENFSRRGHIKIVTYDDLLNQGYSVYKNAVERPIILRSKDQKSI